MTEGSGRLATQPKQAALMIVAPPTMGMGPRFSSAALDVAAQGEFAGDWGATGRSEYDHGPGSRRRSSHARQFGTDIRAYVSTTVYLDKV
ncbi:MAG: hypothetical protein NVS2B16_12100 [Chloroflexota bacterium]